MQPLGRMVPISALWGLLNMVMIGGRDNEKFLERDRIVLRQFGSTTLMLSMLGWFWA
jgi:hypothetical protein